MQARSNNILSQFRTNIHTMLYIQYVTLLFIITAPLPVQYVERKTPHCARNQCYYYFLFWMWRYMRFNLNIMVSSRALKNQDRILTLMAPSR